MYRKLLALLLALALAAASSGCWSRKELEDLAIVTMMGFDKVQAGGQEKWQITVTIIRPGELRSGIGGAGGGRRPEVIFSSLGDTLLETGRNGMARSPRVHYLAHANIIVIGERLARQGVRQVTDFLMRDPRIRLRDWILIAPGEALEVLRAEPELEKLLSQELMGMLDTNQPRVGKAYAVTLKDFAGALTDRGREAVASRVEVFTPMEIKAEAGAGKDAGSGAQQGAKKALRLSGAAVFQGDRLVGWLGDWETRGYLFGLGQVKGGILPLSMHSKKEKDTSISLTRSSSRIIPQVQDGGISFVIDIKAEGDLGEHADPFGIAAPDKMKILEDVMKNEIKRLLEETVRKSQQEFGSDILGLGDHLHKKNSGVWKQVKADWEQIYPTLQVTVNVEAKIRRTGIIGDQPLIR